MDLASEIKFNLILCSFNTIHSINKKYLFQIVFHYEIKFSIFDFSFLKINLLNVIVNILIGWNF